MALNVPSLLTHTHRYCEKRRKVLLSHVHEGYEKDWWLYSD